MPPNPLKGAFPCSQEVQAPFRGVRANFPRPRATPSTEATVNCANVFYYCSL